MVGALSGCSLFVPLNHYEAPISYFPCLATALWHYRLASQVPKVSALKVPVGDFAVLNVIIERKWKLGVVTLLNDGHVYSSRSTNNGDIIEANAPCRPVSDWHTSSRLQAGGSGRQGRLVRKTLLVSSVPIECSCHVLLSSGTWTCFQN